MSRNLYVLHDSTGQSPDPATLDHLCDGNQAAYLGAACGIDMRRLYVLRPSRPLTFRPVAPDHGRYPASLYRPTRRERLASWWRDRLPALRGLAVGLLVAGVLMLYCLLGYLVICGLMDLGNALADWISGI